MKTSTDPKAANTDWSAVQISMVASAKSTETISTRVADVLEAIKSGKWAGKVKPIEAKHTVAFEAAKLEGKADPAAVAKEAVRPDKLKLPGIMFSGRFSRRADNALETHSGILCVDMDNCSAPAELRAKLATDPHVLAAFVSPTGSGVKVLLRIKADASLHVCSFAAAKKHLGGTFGVIVDEQCKNVSRLCFVSHDPHIFIRQEAAEILEPLPQSEQQEQPSQPKPEPEFETYESLPRPCYRVYPSAWKCGEKWYPPGTWLHGRTVNKNGEVNDYDQRICAPLEVLGKSSTRDLEHGRLVEFVSSNRTSKRHIVPMRLLAGRGDEALGELLSLGLETVRKHQSHVLSYIQEATPAERYTAALCTGWQNDDIFVLPDEIIAPVGYAEKTWYGGRDSESPYRCAGSLKQWQDGVAAFAPDNSNLTGALCVAFAGPLLYKFGVPGALLHLFGPSSTGKTTTLAAAASVWGGGTADGKNAYVRSWQSTGVGVEAIASLHSDTLAVLDELHLVEPKVLDPVIYAFSCGQGKNRGNVHAGLRPTKRWRVMGLSSGEMSSSAWLRGGGYHVRSGQMVRMIDVPVQGDHGAFDDLHACGSGRAFSELIAYNVARHYGHAGPAFVRALIEENPDLDEHLDAALAGFDHGDIPVQTRVARVFAIMAVAGELARHYGIVPWLANTALDACKMLFNRWKEQLKASGAETPETKICALVATFISRFADSRFSNIHGNDRNEPRVLDRAGYWKDVSGGPRIYMLRSDALQDACKGYDISDIAQALDAVGALSEKQGDGRLSKRTRTPIGTNERLYHVNPDKLER